MNKLASSITPYVVLLAELLTPPRSVASDAVTIPPAPPHTQVPSNDVGVSSLQALSKRLYEHQSLFLDKSLTKNERQKAQLNLQDFLNQAPSAKDLRGIISDSNLNGAANCAKLNLEIECIKHPELTTDQRALLLNFFERIELYTYAMPILKMRDQMCSSEAPWRKSEQFESPKVSPILPKDEYHLGKDGRWVIPALLSIPKDPFEVTTVSSAQKNAGALIFIRQIHASPHAHGPQLDEIAMFQATILARLLNDRPKAVFTEGLATDYLVDSTLKRDSLWMRQCRDVFPQLVKAAENSQRLKDLQINPLSVAHRNLLALYGGAEVYAACFSDVNLLATDTKEALEVRSRIRVNLSGADLHTEVFDRRERLAAERIGAWMKQHPESKKQPIYLVFGASHVLTSEDFRHSGLQLKIEEATNVNGLGGSNSKQSARLLLQADPVKQAKLINAMVYVSANDLMQISDPALQRVSYCKLYLAKDEQIEEVAKALLGKIKDPELRKRIQSDSQQRTGPFGQLSPRD